MNRINMFALAPLVAAVALTGCAGKRVNTTAERDLSLPVAEAAEASKDVMNDYDFDIQRIDREDGSVLLEGDHVDGQDVEVDISPLGGSRSHVQVKVTRESPKTSANTILDDIAVRYEN